MPNVLQDYALMYAQKIAEEEQARLERYKTHWKYYRGEQPAQLKVKPNQVDDNLILNLYKYIINKGVSFLFGKDVDFQIEEGTETAEEKYLADVWTANDKMSFLQDVALNGGNCGHCFVEIAPRDGDVPRLINLDPAIVRPQWDADDLDKVLWYKIEYPTLDPVAKELVMKKRMIELQSTGTWLITRYIKRPRDPEYVQDGQPIVWDYDFPPIVDWKNLPAPNEYFGAADVDSLAGQDSINFIGSNMKRIIRYHGHPKTIGTGFGAGDVKVDPDEMIVIPTENGKVFNLEMQSDLAASQNFFDKLVDIYLRVNNTPNMDSTALTLGAQSGFALQVLHTDIMNITETKRRLYGDGIEEINRRVRILAGIADPMPTKLIWQNPLPRNQSEQVDQLIKEVDAKFTSRETAQQELGRDPETENARIQAEQAGENTIGAQLLRAFNAGQTPNQEPAQPIAQGANDANATNQ